MPPAPITAPVVSLTPEPRGVLSSQPSVLVGGHAPPGAPGELSLQVTGAACSPPLGNSPTFLECRKTGSMVAGPHSSTGGGGGGAEADSVLGNGCGQVPNVLTAEKRDIPHSPAVLCLSGSSVTLTH